MSAHSCAVRMYPAASKVGEIAFCRINPWSVPVIAGRMTGTAAVDADGSVRVIG
ncbi:hypothetical protein [Corynebacterium argentoratense]|uniref:hypothetical protein n=1 Tax=Corynebacterium argentoratense TaxID=42817 RepID=UPI00146F980F|nr:hypothetical protein [Corynebacterium argentoratense]